VRRRMVGGAAAAAVLTLLVVGACSSGSGGSGGSRAGAAKQNAGAGGAVGDAAGAVGAGGQAAVVEPAQAAKQAPAAAGAPVVLEAKIRTARMTVAVRGAANVAARADAATAVATGAGGEVDADDRTGGKQASAVMQLRVPPTALRGALDELAKLGKEQSRQVSSVDVSEKVADVDSRVASARDAIARLRTLYSSATKVGDVIAVESELSGREADLEALQAQQRTLARQTSMATITLTLQTASAAAAPPPAKKKAGGFVGGLERGWTGFVAAAAWVAAAVGTVLPFLALLVLVALGARVLWRRVPHRGPSPAPAPSE
jgi:hypothetical protein